MHQPTVAIALLILCFATITHAVDRDKGIHIIKRGSRAGATWKRAMEEMNAIEELEDLLAVASNISYHGGPVMTGPTIANLIWYGTSWSDNEKSIITTFCENLGSSSWWNINTVYKPPGKTGPSPVLTYGSAYHVPTLTYGASISDAQVFQLVKDGIEAGAFTAAPNAVYLVLTDESVTASSGFCSHYCGWHTFGNAGNGVKVKYGFVGNARTKCPNSCAYASAITPNGDSAIDGMISVMAHEFAEAVTDPELNAWYDVNGYENADKCAWNFGLLKSCPGSGCRFNVEVKVGLKKYKYLIQQNWNVDTQGCTLSL